MQQELTIQHLSHVGITPITRENNVMSSKFFFFNEVLKCKHFQTLFPKSKNFSHFGITWITLGKYGLCGNLCHLAASLPQTYVLFKAFKLSPWNIPPHFHFMTIYLLYTSQPPTISFFLKRKAWNQTLYEFPGWCVASVLRARIFIIMEIFIWDQPHRKEPHCSSSTRYQSWKM